MSAIERVMLAEFEAYDLGDALPAPAELDAAVPRLDSHELGPGAERYQQVLVTWTWPMYAVREMTLVSISSPAWHHRSRFRTANR
jgi:hypothetical protein